MKDLAVAIIILNWRQPVITIECVKSVLANTYKSFKIFLIDNNSGDDSEQIFKREFFGIPEVKILKTSTSLGYGGGNNRGAEKALKEGSFDYLCILNNDTLVEKNFLKALISTAKKLSDDNIYIPLILYWQSKVIQSAGLMDYLPTPFQFKYKKKENKEELLIEESPFLRGCCFLIKTDIFRRIGGFREDFFMYAEDIDLGLKAKKMGAKIYLVPQAKIWHKGGVGFSPAGAYYTVRNSFYLIKEQLNKKFYEYLRALCWFILLGLAGIIFLKPQITRSCIKGIIAFLKNERYKNPHY